MPHLSRVVTLGFFEHRPSQSVIIGDVHARVFLPILLLDLPFCGGVYGRVKWISSTSGKDRRGTAGLRNCQH